MRTLRHAAERLAAAHTADGRLALAGWLGFDELALPVDGDARTRLGIPTDLDDARIVRGPGALRALLVSARGEPSLRALMTRIATALDARTSHALWVVIGAAANDEEVGLACWSRGARAPRVVALVASRRQVVAADASALCALQATAAGEDLLMHSRWCELLGREALSRRFYRALEQRVSALAESLPRMSPTDRGELALLCVSRLLFLSFLEAKGWLNGDRAFLVKRFDDCMASGGRFHQRVLLPLFFGTLNTPMRQRARAAHAFGAIPFLNGGLFAKTTTERRHASARFGDDALGTLFGELLSAYRFTAREGMEQWSEAAIDPEMLGHAFESLMAARERRVTGAFYTPQALVTHVSERALVCSLSGDGVSEEHVRGVLAGEAPNPDIAALLRARLRSFTLLDPACGSGAFLVHLLERLTTLHRLLGDIRPVPVIRREVLARCIHGVDVNPSAVWLCELRLWLSVVIESDESQMSAVPPLPNLDCNVRVGDTLSGEAFIEPPSLVGPPAALARLRERYVKAAGAKKAPLRQALAREERRRALASLDRALVRIVNLRRERILAQRSADLFGQRATVGLAERTDMRTLRLRAAALRGERARIAAGGALPFSFPSHFGAAHARGGFDLVVGNPPWVRLHNIPPAARAVLRARFTVFRAPAWDPENSDSAQRGFAAQIDLAALFVERSLHLTRPAGSFALLLPVKLWHSLSGAGVRQLLANGTKLRLVEDWSQAPAAFNAAVYPSVVIASRCSVPATEIQVGVRRRSLDLAWRVTHDELQLVRNDLASPWLLLPPDARAAFQRIAERGRPLSRCTMGRAILGVKCGCNEAFMVESAFAHDVGQENAPVEQRGRRGIVERALLRPLLRGDSLTAWAVPASSSAIVWTHAGSGSVLATLPPGAARWLAPWRRQLCGRSDLRGSPLWWMLFRTDAADCSRSRVVWSDFGRRPRAALLPAGDQTVPLNSCYVLPCDNPTDALALTALLNTPVAAAWLNAIAEPARGGWHRYLAWTVSLLPIPRDWAHARSLLAPLTERALLGAPPSEDELLHVACRAYRLRPAAVAPLVAWCH